MTATVTLCVTAAMTVPVTLAVTVLVTGAAFRGSIRFVHEYTSDSTEGLSQRRCPLAR